MPAPPSATLSVYALQGLRAWLLVNPGLWQLLAVVAAPVRLAVTWHLWAGRSLRSLASELARRLLLLAGWLSGRVEHRRLRGFDRRYFVLRRWHVATAALAAARVLAWADAAWRDAASGRRQLRRELQRRLQAAEVGRPRVLVGRVGPGRHVGSGGWLSYSAVMGLPSLPPTPLLSGGNAALCSSAALLMPPHQLLQSFVEESSKGGQEQPPCTHLHPMPQAVEDWTKAAQELEALEGPDPRARCLLEARLYDRRLLQAS